MKWIFAIALTAISIFKIPSVFAAACCSGGSSSSAIILSDDRWNFKFATVNRFVVADVNQSGKSRFREDAFEETALGFTPTVIFKSGDHFQFAGNFSLWRRSALEDSSWGWGDTQMSTNLEPFPIYTYSPYRPRFFLTAGISMPTGESVYDTNRAMTDANGTGFWTPFFSMSLSKTIGDFDFLSNASIRWQVPRSFRYENVEPGNIYSAQLAVGYHFSKFRLGIGVQPTYEEKRKLLRGNATSASKLVWDSTFDLSMTATTRWSGNLSYSDQTLMGPAFNVALERSLAFQLIYHGL